MTRAVPLAAAVLACAALPAGAKEMLPDAARAALTKADQLELYSLDPSKEDDKDKDAFHGYKVLGKTTVKADDARKALADAVLKGVADSDGAIAKCFDPRHGVRAVYDGKTYDLVICFQCSQIHTYGADNDPVTTGTTGGPEPALDKLLKDAGVPLAAKPGK
jgi:hypothetical protein